VQLAITFVFKGHFAPGYAVVGLDQYRATMMIATTMNAAISESARSSVFDRGVAAVVSSRGNDNLL
jgi:hypothetical protein